MLKQIPFRKEYLLYCGTVLLLLLGYQLALKKTIEALQINRNLNRQLSQSTDVSAEPGYQERKNVHLDQIIGLYKADTIDFRSNIISSITQIADKEHVSVAAVPTRDPLFHSPAFLIQKLDMEGD